MRKAKLYAQCFYCEQVLRRSQGRAAHIRKAHPGAPYKPTPEQIASYKAKMHPAAQPPPVEPALPPASPLSPREHLVAAISEIKEQLAATRQQIPALEIQLEGLRAAHVHMEQDLCALETALTSIGGGTSQPPPQSPAEAPAEPTEAAPPLHAEGQEPGKERRDIPHGRKRRNSEAA